MTKIMISGGAGYVGSVLTEEFLKAGHSVIVLDLLKRGPSGILSHANNENFTLVNSDFMSAALDITLDGVDIVIHLAAIVGDKACDDEPELATLTNVDGVRYLVKKCNNHKIPLIFASTCSVYGSNPNACTEESIINPISHYSRTKYKAEKIIKKCSENALIFRFGTMYGWSPNMRFDLVVNLLVRSVVKTGEFKIFGGKQIRPFLHPRDLGLFLISLFEKEFDYQYKEVYNLVSENLSMIDLGELIQKVIPYALMKLVPEIQVERTYICRTFKAYRDLGFMPNIRVRDGIQEIEKELLMLKERNNVLDHIAF